MVFDEIYVFFILFGVWFMFYLSVFGVENVFVLMLVFKVWNFGGFKVVLVIVGCEVVVDFVWMFEEVGYGFSYLGVIVYIVVFRIGGNWFDVLLCGLDYN